MAAEGAALPTVTCVHKLVIAQSSARNWTNLAMLDLNWERTLNGTGACLILSVRPQCKSLTCILHLLLYILWLVLWLMYQGCNSDEIHGHQTRHQIGQHCWSKELVKNIIIIEPYPCLLCYITQLNIMCSGDYLYLHMLVIIHIGPQFMQKLLKIMFLMAQLQKHQCVHNQVSLHNTEKDRTKGLAYIL